jgi:hypothetical protein
MFNNKTGLAAVAAIYAASVGLIYIGSKYCADNGASTLAVAAISAGAIGTLFVMHKAIDKAIAYSCSVPAVVPISTATFAANTPVEAASNANLATSCVYRAGFVVDNTTTMTNT